MGIFTFRPGGSLISGTEFMVSNLFYSIADALRSGWSRDGNSPYNFLLNQRFARSHDTTLIVCRDSICLTTKQLHFVIGAWCPRYFEQINFLHHAAPSLGLELGELPGRGMSAKAKQGITQRIKAGF